MCPVEELSHVNQALKEAVEEAMTRHGLSLRGMEYKTGINHTTILQMKNGRVPSKGIVIDLAVGLGEDVNKWLELAGYPPLPYRTVTAPADQVREVMSKYAVPGRVLTVGDIEQMSKEIEGLGKE